ncbi:TPA: hypothetical protein ACN9E7_003023, partial [Staphylococcus aureus]
MSKIPFNKKNSYNPLHTKDYSYNFKIELFLYSIKTRRNSFSTRFKNLSKTINPQKYHANDTQNTRLQLKN